MKHALNVVNPVLHTTCQLRTRCLHAATRARRLAIALAAIAGTLGGMVTSAKGAVVEYDRLWLGKEADFGSGTHSAGHPNNGTVTWSFNPNANGVVVVEARIQGTLYLDRLGAGRAELEIKFLNSSGSTLTTRRVQFCGPGWDANNSENKRPVDISFSHVNLRRVELSTGAMSCGGSFNPDSFKACAPPLTITKNIAINNGPADFGSGSHAFGTPVGNAMSSIVLQSNGLCRANVTGTLYWDSYYPGCARLFISFFDASGNLLSQRMITRCGVSHGNAAQLSNQTAVNETFISARVYKISITTGIAEGQSGIVNTASVWHGYM